MIDLSSKFCTIYISGIPKIAFLVDLTIFFKENFKKCSYLDLIFCIEKYSNNQTHNCFKNLFLQMHSHSKPLYFGKFSILLNF